VALQGLLAEQAQEFLGTKLPQQDPAEVFFAYRPQEQEAAREVTQAYDEAAPELAGPRPKAGTEFCLLAAPAGPAGDRFRALARQALPDVLWTEAITPDDLVFYREAPIARLADLPHLGPQAREAVGQFTTQEGTSPHARGDVAWLPVAKEGP
jgi:hypothetical protein